MPRSMTGFGRAQQTLHERDIAVEVKSVNARYFEYTSRLPRSCNFLDDQLKKAVSAAAGRGKTELYLSVQNLGTGETQVQANLPMAAGYRQALREISTALDIPDDVGAAALARFGDIFTLRRAEADEDLLAADVLAVAEEALARFNAMREAEGEKLVADVRGRLAALEGMLAEVAQSSAGRVARYTEKLYERLQELLADRTIDEARLLTEAAIFADKTAVDEETVRLASHLQQFADVLDAGGAVGRKLDFLTQELNRETNTIGSKCQEVDITRLVVEMKAEIEKIREQIQNLE